MFCLTLHKKNGTSFDIYVKIMESNNSYGGQHGA